jgi:hypothetical protein
MALANAIKKGPHPELSKDAPSDCSVSPYPRPMNGILVAMMVMNCTFVSSGRLAM